MKDHWFEEPDEQEAWSATAEERRVAWFERVTDNEIDHRFAHDVGFSLRTPSVIEQLEMAVDRAIATL